MTGRARVSWLEHDADLRLRVSAPDPERLFTAAARAVVEASVEGTIGDDLRRRIELAGPDKESLLVAWLNEILFLIFSGRFLPARVDRIRIEENTLAATLAGGPPDPEKQRFVREIKAATFHGLAVERSGAAWTATILFDV